MLAFLVGLIPGLASLLTGLPGVATALIDHLNKKADVGQLNHATDIAADKEVNLAVVQAHLETQKLISAQRAADRGSIWTAWMMPAAFAVSLYHYGAIVLDSTSGFGHQVGSWGVAVLPGAYASSDLTIILSVCGIVSGKAIVGRIFSKA